MNIGLGHSHSIDSVLTILNWTPSKISVPAKGVGYFASFSVEDSKQGRSYTVLKLTGVRSASLLIYDRF